MSMIGKSLIHYEISALIGRGGMGEVYQAKDTKLGRDVAIKILPEEFARDADRAARFQREAKLLASLNHPNIAAIHGLEESDGTTFLVMELIEGDTLSDRIKTGPIPVEDALKLALQIAEALEAAHEKGVIHRDLKPANIKITPEGKIKVLDFGLAKAFAEDQGEEKPLDSPTLSDAATRKGIILGTAAYMSPEQARGKPVDKRADIWAFGVILFEMLTGRAVFEGEDVTSTLARVLERDPDFSTLPPNLHPRIRFLLERCLEKEDGNRYSSIGDARVEIQKVLADPGGVIVQPIAGFEPQWRTRTTLTWVAAIVILTAIIVGVIVWNLKSTEPRQISRFYYEVPADHQLNRFFSPGLAVSPDGRQIVYDSGKGLYSRSISEMDAKLITGTDNDDIFSPFFSPDGKWIAYFSRTDNQLKKIPILGGSPIPLCDILPRNNTGDWTGNKIIFSSIATHEIMEILDNGGIAEPLFEKKEDALAYLFPQMLPDGKSVLFTRLGDAQNMSIMVKSLETGEIKEITPGSNARYLPTGHLVYFNRDQGNRPTGNLFAVPFDIDKLELTGEPLLMVENIFGSRGGVAGYAISDSGTLVYVPFEPFGPFLQETENIRNPMSRTFLWVDREGKEEELTAPPRFYLFPKISPDGKQVAFVAQEDLEKRNNREIFIWDIVHKTLNKRTFDKSGKYLLVWTPDGERIVYGSTHENLDRGGVYWRPANGTGEAEKLASEPDRGLMPYSFTSDGKYLLLQEAVTNTNLDISMLSMEDDRKRIPLIQTEFIERHPIISPDDQYIAYSSNETGQYEIYVRPFPDVDKGKWQISQGGGTVALWSPDGRELFYLDLDNSVVVVDVKTKPTFHNGTPRILFQDKYIAFMPKYIAFMPSTILWDIHPDGKRFLMVKNPFSDIREDINRQSRKINIVLNWIEELKQRVPVD